MNDNTTDILNIQHIEKSKITEVDFDNLDFGKTFTDYMFECDYVDGKWQNPTIKPYGPMPIDPSATVFHYGQAFF
jgi:branched-chain amino acid aminotransferase